MYALRKGAAGILLVLAVLFAIACASGGGPTGIEPPPQDKPEVETLTVSPRADGSATCGVVLRNVFAGMHSVWLTVTPFPGIIPAGWHPAISCFREDGGTVPVLQVQLCNENSSCGPPSVMRFRSDVTYTLMCEVFNNSDLTKAMASKSVGFSGASTAQGMLVPSVWSVEWHPPVPVEELDWIELPDGLELAQ